MAKERINTGFDKKPQGKYILEVVSIKKKTITGKTSGRTFAAYECNFEVRQCDQELDDNTLRILYFKSQMGDLLRALEAKEISPDQFEFDTEEVKGKLIECQLFWQIVSGVERETLIEIKAFKGEVPAKTAEKPGEEVEWDAGR